MTDSSLPKVLLIKYHDTNIRPIPDKAERTLQVVPSLGILYLASTLRQAGFPVELLDANAERLSPRVFQERVKASGARIVGMTSMTAGWPSTVEGARIVRALLPQATIVVGGPQLSVHPELCLTFDCFDIGVIGGGEEGMLEICQAVAGGRPYDNITGTVVRVDGTVKVNPMRTEWLPLDAHPFPAVDLLKREYYQALTVDKSFFTMVTSRGCPFTCHFCGQEYGGKKQKCVLRNPESVVEEIDLYVNKYGAREIVFFDETFTLKKARVLEICRLINERGIKVSYDIRTRVDSVDEEIFAAVRSIGAKRVHLGIESGTQKIIDRMGKGITLEQVYKAVSLAKKYGFDTRGYFMIGYLGEDPQTYKETVALASRLKLDYASFSVTTPLPQTQLFEEAVKLGLISEDYWKKYTLLQCDRLDFPVLETEYWDEEELRRMMRKAFRSFYLQPRLVWKKLTSVRSWNDVKDLLGGLCVLKGMS